MKIFGISRVNKALTKELVENPITMRVKLTSSEDLIDFSAKETKSTKLSRIKTKFKKMLVGLDKATITHLEKLPINEFLAESQKIIAKGMGLSQDFLPSLNITPIANKKMAMAFDWSNNTLFVSNQILSKSKITLFSAMRHEMEHFRQNLQIIRTEELGEKAIETYSKMLTTAQVDNFVNTFRKMPESEILKLKEAGNLSEAGLQAVKKVQIADAQGDEAIYKVAEELVNQDYPLINESWQNIRNKSIELQGPIKANTKEASDAKEYFDGFLKTNGMAGGMKYYSSKHEVEADGAQSFAMYEYLFRKLFG